MTLYSPDAPSINPFEVPKYNRSLIHEIVRLFGDTPPTAENDGVLLGYIYQKMAEYKLPLANDALVLQIKGEVYEEIHGLKIVEKMIKVRTQFNKQLSRAIIKLDQWSVASAEDQIDTIVIDSIPEILEDQLDSILDEARAGIRKRLESVKIRLLQLKASVDMPRYEIKKRARKVVARENILMDDSIVDGMVTPSKQKKSKSRGSHVSRKPNLSRKSRGYASNPRAASRGKRN